MDLIDFFVVWTLFSVCITPVLLAIQLITHIRWYKKFHEAIRLCKRDIYDYEMPDMHE